jgi:hypothetical protein
LLVLGGDCERLSFVGFGGADLAIVGGANFERAPAGARREAHDEGGEDADALGSERVEARRAGELTAAPASCVPPPTPPRRRRADAAAPG